MKSPEGEELDMVLKELDNLETDSARIIREITAEQKVRARHGVPAQVQGGGAGGLSRGANATLIEIFTTAPRTRTRTGMKELADEDLMEEKVRIYAPMV